MSREKIMSAEARSQIVQACRVLQANGHADYIWGHVSLREEGGRGLWMKPAGLGFDEVQENSVLLVGFDGSVLAGKHPRHSEWPIHAELLSNDPELHSVVHTHPPHAIALAATGAPLLPISHAGSLFIPPAVPRFERTANLIDTPELGRAVVATLGGLRAGFLVNHGIITAGATVKEAVARAILLEKACEQQLLALGAGRPLHGPGDSDSLRKRATVWPTAHLESLWDYLVRRTASTE